MTQEMYRGHVFPRVGSTYKTRSGRIEKIIHYDKDESATPFQSASGRWFSRSGIHYADGDTRQHDLYTEVR